MLGDLPLPLALLLGAVGLVALCLLMLAVRRRLLSRDGAFTCACGVATPGSGAPRLGARARALQR